MAVSGRPCTGTSIEGKRVLAGDVPWGSRWGLEVWWLGRVLGPQDIVLTMALGRVLPNAAPGDMGGLEAPAILIYSYV